MKFYRIKKVLKRFIAPLLLYGKKINWRTRLPHILIECLPAYSKSDWLNTLNEVFPAWQESIEVQFFNNFAECDCLVQDTDIYISTWFSKDLLGNSSHLKLVQLIGSGVEFLGDLNSYHKICITNASGISSASVAEHVVMLMLALDRRLDLAINRQKFWKWDQRGIIQNIRRLKGSIAGIVGLGHNGRAVAHLALRMGMKVVGIDIRQGITIPGVKKCSSLSELFTTSDFVILCVPLTNITRKMIGFNELKK